MADNPVSVKNTSQTNELGYIQYLGVSKFRKGTANAGEQPSQGNGYIADHPGPMLLLALARRFTAI